MTKINLNWIKCTNNIWCDFLKLDLDNDHFNNINGVYIIFNSEKVIRVGSGNIKDRISAHRNDEEINKFKNLKVTWAKVEDVYLYNVEKYLSLQYNIEVGERFPDVKPIEVNLP